VKNPRTKQKKIGEKTPFELEIGQKLIEIMNFGSCKKRKTYEGVGKREEYAPITGREENIGERL
jgi:hypothetical protein